MAPGSIRSWCLDPNMYADLDVDLDLVPDLDLDLDVAPHPQIHAYTIFGSSI